MNAFVGSKVTTKPVELRSCTEIIVWICFYVWKFFLPEQWIATNTATTLSFPDVIALIGDPFLLHYNYRLITLSLPYYPR